MQRGCALWTDEELFRRCRQSGDPDEIRQAVALLATRHKDGLVRYLARMVRSVEIGEELAQEAFIRIYRHAVRYQDIAKVRTWLYRIAHNLALNAIRDRKRRPAVTLGALGALGGEDGQDAAASLADPRAADPADGAAQLDLRERVRRAVDQLPDHFRGAVVLCDLEGLSYQEAADVLEVKIGTIRSRLFRGREQLADLLRPLQSRGAL